MDFPFRGFDVIANSHHGTRCRSRLPPQPRDGEVPFIRWGICVLRFRRLIYYASVAYAVALITVTSANADDPRYRLGYGDNSNLCKAQFKMLAMRSPTQPIPVCDIGVNLPPDVERAEWQELDIYENLEMAEKIDWELRFEISRRPTKRFDVWQHQMHRRMKNPKTRPHLYRLKPSLKKDGQSENLYGYSIGAGDCDSSNNKTWAHYPGMHFFMYDDQRKFADRLPASGHLAFHQGQPYIFSSGLTDKTHYWVWHVAISGIRARSESRYSPNLYDPPFSRNYEMEGICGISASDMFGPPQRR